MFNYTATPQADDARFTTFECHYGWRMARQLREEIAEVANVQTVGDNFAAVVLTTAVNAIRAHLASKGWSKAQ